MFLESQTLELKRELGDMQRTLKTACAFANTHGGKIIIGVDDSGTIVGIPHDGQDAIQQRVVQGLRQLNPTPFYHIDLVDESGAKIIQVEIEPMMYGAICSFQGNIYYRHGSVTERAEGAILQELLAKRRVIDFELTLSRAEMIHLDIGTLEEYLRMRSPDIRFEPSRVESYLIGLNLMPAHHGGRVNNAGVIFFHPRPAELLSQVEIKLVRFKGITATKILDAAFLSKPMLRLLAEAESFIMRNTRNAFEYHGLDRVEVPEYPVNVVREALVNSVVHRDYFDRNAIQINIFDDRIEFMNPGPLPEGLSMGSLGSYSVQRNPIIYTLLRDVHKVEGLATGIPKMKEMLREGGYPQPSFEEPGGKFFRVTIHNKEFAGHEWLSEVQKMALRLAQKNGSITTDELAVAASVPRTTAMDQIRTLVEKELLTKVGKTKGVKYVVRK